MQNFCFDRIKVLVTSYCNLECKHCYQHFDKNKYNLSKEQIFEIIDFAFDNNTRVLDFSGGEFFVHPHAYDIIDYCFSKNINVNIATNAINIETEFLEKYKNTDFLSIQVSIDGLKRNHEQRRGIGTWERTMKHVNELYEIGIPLSLNMVLDNENYLDAFEVLQLPYFTQFLFSPMAYVGAATIFSSTDNQAEYEEVVCYLMKEFECDEETFEKQIFPYVLSIKYDGKVYVSPIASDYDVFCLGSINDNSLKDICCEYYQSEEFEQLSAIDVMNIEDCKKCKVSETCSRGCRFRAFKFFGDILQPDPMYCRFFLDDYKEIPIGKLFWGIE